MRRFRWLLALALVMFAGTFAFAQTQATRRAQPERRSVITPPPLPIATGTPAPDATLKPSAATRTFLGSQLVPFRGRRPAMLTLEQARRHLLNVNRRPRNASGGTITLLGDHNAYSVNNTPYVTDYTIGYGTQVGFDCSNMLANESNVQIVIFAPDGTAFGTPSTFSTNGNGQCASNVKDVTLATPYGSYTDAPYPGVWAAALYRTGSTDYEAVTYFVVQSETPMTTYSDGALNYATRDFTKGQTVYVVASNLNPSDAYAMGWVYTAKPPLQCVYALPSTYVTNGPNCFYRGLAGLTGTTATSGQFEGAWNTTGASLTGTYSIQLFDVTKNRLVSTQQISLRATTDPAVTISGYAVGSSVSVAQTIGDDAFAHDGLADQSVAALGFTVNGLTASHGYKISLSNPNGAVLQPGPASAGSTETHLAFVPTVTTNTSGTLVASPVPLPTNAVKLTAMGPTQTSFVNTTMTAQVVDATTNAVVTSKSFTLLAYAASIAWQGTNSVNADAGACKGTANYLTVTNNAQTLYGSLGADGIVGVAIGPDSGANVNLCIPTGITTATDSAGKTWAIGTTTFGGRTYVTATINQVANTDALQPGGTLTFPVDIGAPSSRCTTTPPCGLQTRIKPLHGLSYSADDSVSSGLLVGGKNNTINPSVYGWAVTAPAPIASIPAPPPFTQMMYVSGTNATTSANTYTLVATVSNNNPTGSGQGLQDILFTFPPGWDFTVAANKPTVSVKLGGVPLPGWNAYTANGTSNNVTVANSFAVACGTSNNLTPCAGQIQPGATVTVTLTMPMPPIAFALYPITATGNFDGGCIGNTGGGKCTGYVNTPLNANGTLNNTVAGAVNIDSTTLGVYSLDTTKMSGVFAPAQIGAGVATNTTFTFTNTSGSADPNPDYVDQIALTFPSGVDPGLAGITAPTGWTASGSSGTYTLTAAACTGTPCQEAYAIAPGGTLAIPIAYTNATAGTYSVTWKVKGANGNAVSSTSGTSTLKVTTTAASSQWKTVGGYPTSFAVTSGSEPTVGSDADKTYGNAYTYRITNTGQDTITSLSIVVPWKNRFATAGTDSGGLNWTFTGTPSITVTPSTAGHGCTTLGTPVSPTSSADGHIDASSCNIQKGDYVDVGFTLKAPYQIGSEFDFKANVCSAITPCAGGPPYTSGGQPASAVWSTAEFIKIVADGRLSVVYYNGTPTIGLPPALPNPAPGGSTPTTSCTGCQVTAITPTPVIDLGGAFVGNVTFTDLFDVVVTSDVNSPNQWTLYVSADVNPLNGSSNPEMAMTIHDAVMYLPQNHGFAGDTYAIPAAASGGTYFYIPTTTPGQQIGNYSGNAYRTPLDSVQTLRANTTGDATGHTITLTYTLIVN